MTLPWRRWRAADLPRSPLDSDDYEPHPTRAYERFEPVPVVLDVCVDPPDERGYWWARWWTMRGDQRKGRAETIEEAKEQALDAAECMLADALERLEQLRVSVTNERTSE